MAKIVVITPGFKGVYHELGTQWVTIGRAPDNSFQIVESSISGHHCEVRSQGEELLVRDMRSTNGTFINGSLATEGVVKIGQKFRIGDVELRLEASNGVLPQPAARPSPTTAQNGSAVNSGKKARVLMVDDSMAFLETTGELFETLAAQTWELHRASAADQALVILQKNFIDLVILDIGMPTLDGIQLLNIVHRRYPDLKKVVLTAQATTENRSSCLSGGAELFLEKPVTAEGFKLAFNVINDLICWNQKEGFSGTLKQVGLTDVIQIECLARRSCILDVRNPKTHGSIYIECGTIIHATTENLTGEKAFQRLLALNNGEFHLRPFAKPPEQTMQGAWEYLLMEAACLRDEERTALSIAETMFLDRSAASKQSTTPAELPQMGEGIVVVSTYDGQWHPADGSK